MNGRRWSVRRGFSLLELLVVIAIITVLLALLVPGLGAARARARQICCAAKLRGVGTALMLYVNDNQQRLPFIDEPLWTPDGTLNWQADPMDAATAPHSFWQVMKTYLGSADLLRCPSALLGYPAEAWKVTYRIASADNYDGQLGSVFAADGTPKYAYSLKYLDGRRYQIRHIQPGAVPMTLADGPGPYYLLRDFVAQQAAGQFKMAHGQNFNQLYLDWSVSLSRDPTYGLTYP